MIRRNTLALALLALIVSPAFCQLITTAPNAGVKSLAAKVAAKPVPANDQHWIWAPDTAALPETVYFRQPFTLAATPSVARIRIEARDAYTVYVNGQRVLERDRAIAPESVYITRSLRLGRNVVAIQALNTKGQGGITFDIFLRFSDGRDVDIVSRQAVRVTRDPMTGWQSAEYNDSLWRRSKEMAEYSIPAPTNNTSASQPNVKTNAAAVGATGHTAYDYARLVRTWDIYAGGAPAADVYARPRNVGDRMLMSTSLPSVSDLSLVRSEGFTLLQTDSDHLSTEETAPGIWDFRKADDALKFSTANGFDWCYFPHYAFPPAWYSKQVPYTRIRCLEHNQDVQAFSPWDPKFGAFASRGYDKLAQKYAQTTPAIGMKGQNGVNSAIANALYLGVHGDFGECGFLMGARTSIQGMKEDWQKRFGDLHDHLGWWCGDTLSLTAFRIQMQRKYHDIELLNASWNTKFTSFDDVAYPLSQASVSRRYWLDFAHWYLDSGSTLTDTICRVARRAFPQTLLSLPVGFTDENTRGGNDNTMIPKIAARYKVEVRSTHGGVVPFAENQAGELGRIGSACRFYGVPFWSEPPGATTPARQVDRIFSAVSQGSKGYFDWGYNLKSARDVYYKYGKHLRVEQPVVDVAMFFPTTSHLLRPEEGYPPVFAKGCSTIRDILNYDTVDERMVMDGALSRYRVLVLWEGTVIEADVLAKLRDWVESGGVIAAYDFGKVETVEGDRSWFSDLFGYAGKLRGAGTKARFTPEGPLQDVYRITVGNPDASQYLIGDWFEPEVQNGIQKRWTGPIAELKLPVNPTKLYTLYLRASAPVEAMGLKREVLVNGKPVGVLDMAGEMTYRFAVPVAAIGNAPVATVSIRSETWTPEKLIAGSSDSRWLGACITYVQMDATAGGAPVTDPGMPAGHFDTELDVTRLRDEWARPYGKGWTVYFPATKAQLPGYYEVVRYLTYHLSDLDRTKRDAIAVDDAWDGVYATLFSDKVLYYNPTNKPMNRSLVLSPDAFAGRTDVMKPTAFTHSLSVEPNGIAPVYFGEQPLEMLLQCEKFTDLRGQKPMVGDAYSPGRGATNVVIKPGAFISTRFNCTRAGTYRICYRTLRKGKLAPVDLFLDGVALHPIPTVRPSGDTLFGGFVDLTRGIHGISLRPRKGEDVRADFVVLTNDPTISGYTFAVK